MTLSCGAKCAKVVLIVFNLIFWLSGAAILATGIYILMETDKATLFKLFEVDGNYSVMQYLAFALIGVGGLVFIVGFFGCCGAVRESKCLLITYFLFLFIILGCELAIGILAVIYHNKVIDKMKTNLTEKLQNDYGFNKDVTEAIDFAQVKFRCCGINGADDYVNSNWKKDVISKENNVSKTCCLLVNDNNPEAYKEPHPVNDTFCQSEDSSTINIYRHQSGCLIKLEDFVRRESTVLIGIGCGIAGLEVFGMIFSICLCKDI
ncbi:CD151 antigen-like isoform X2 [Tachypleus tridentatus]|uniref:CD151 antigen-like isoform X2 n=1 Tax=Tachypleus tridentatus TaxID=6853 RepID=UPI003FD03036